MTASAYASEAYARSLAGFGDPLALPGCGGHLLARVVPGGGATDAMGCYPLFACAHPDRLRDDLAALGRALVSVALVPDPYGGFEAARHGEAFDRVVRFKERFVHETARPVGDVASRHHRYQALRALRAVEVEVAADPPALLDDWVRLYAALVARHRLRGLKALSRDVFAAQLALPGLVAVVARHGGAVVSAHLWLEGEGVAYSHLAASSEAGYALDASYAVTWRSLEHFRGRVALVDLGAGAGAGQAEDGLVRFKRGWATATRPTYFCGKVLDAAAYGALVTRTGTAASRWFPAYRDGELA